MPQNLLSLAVKVDPDMLKQIEAYLDSVDAYSRGEGLRELISIGLASVNQDPNMLNLIRTIKANAKSAAIQRLHALVMGATNVLVNSELSIEGEDLID